MRRWRQIPLMIGLVAAVGLACLPGCGRDRVNPIDPSFAGNEALGPPTNLRAEGGIGGVALTWTAVSSGDLAGYGVWRAASATGDYARLSGEVSDSLVTTARNAFADTTMDLSVTKVYYYKLNTVDVLGRSSGLSAFAAAEALEDTRPPAAPSDLTAVTDVLTGDVNLIWTAPQSDASNQELTGLAGYQVFRAKDTQDAFVSIGTAPSGQTTFTDSSGLEVDAR